MKELRDMIYNIFFKEMIYLYQTLIISLVLAVVAVPFLWSLSLGDMEWIFLGAIIWCVGVFAFFFPFIKFIFPQMLTSIGVFLLGLILSLVTIWFNLNIIILFVGDKNIYDSMILGVSFNALIIFGWFYVIVTGVIVHGILYQDGENKNSSLYILISNHTNFYKNILNASFMVVFLFLIPISVLFIEQITYDFRVIIAFISLIIGFIAIYKNTTILVSQKSIFYTVTLFILITLSIVIIHATIIMAIGYDKIPSMYIQKNNASMKYEVYKNEPNSFKDTENRFFVYRTITYIPILGFTIGYKKLDVNATTIMIKKDKNGKDMIVTQRKTQAIEP